MEESPTRVKVELLIGQLEEEVKGLFELQKAEVERLKEGHLNLNNVSDQIDVRLKNIGEQYNSKIHHLENEIIYLKELNSSQRMMMEDNQNYIQKLEQRLNPLM